MSATEAMMDAQIALDNAERNARERAESAIADFRAIRAARERVRAATAELNELSGLAA